MAVQYVCDRCGQVGTEDSVVNTVISHGRTHGTPPVTVLNGPVDLCTQCRGELHEWLKPIPQATLVRE